MGGGRIVGVLKKKLAKSWLLLKQDMDTCGLITLFCLVLYTYCQNLTKIEQFKGYLKTIGSQLQKRKFEHQKKLVIEMNLNI